MSLSEQIKSDFTIARKDISEEGRTRLSTLRLLLAAVKNEEISLKMKEGLNESQLISVIRREVKRRKDAAETYYKHNEKARAGQEEKEISILSVYLPPEPNSEDMEKVIRDTLESIPESERNVGSVMKEVMPKFQGTADGSVVKKIVIDLMNSK